jgi:four helix bundle protein
MQILEVWNAAMGLAVRVYELTKTYPREEIYGLTSQVRRAAVSVASNIAEGKGRSSDRELIQFLCHSRGLFEIETQITIAERLGYGRKQQYVEIRSETAKIGRMLNGLIRSVGRGVVDLNSRKGSVAKLKPEA